MKFEESNPILLPQQWEAVRNSAIIKIFEIENDFNDYICTQSYCGSIWISIDATQNLFNDLGGEFKFHSIINNAPAYRYAQCYFVHDGSEWYIMSESRFLDGLSGGWFKNNFKGTLKNFEPIQKKFFRQKSDIVATTMAGSRKWLEKQCNHQNL